MCEFLTPPPSPRGGARPPPCKAYSLLWTTPYRMQGMQASFPQRVSPQPSTSTDAQVAADKSPSAIIGRTSSAATSSDAARPKSRQTTKAGVLDFFDFTEFFTSSQPALVENEAPADDEEEQEALDELVTLADRTSGRSERVSHVELHPHLRDVLFVSVAFPGLFDERAEKYRDIMLQENVVTVWSLFDPNKPQLHLFSPDEVQVFLNRGRGS